jgi:hypothetical protein
LVANQEDTGEARHGLVNLDFVEMEADFPGRNEIGHRFLDGIRLPIAVDFDNGEPQQPQPCPDAKPYAMQSALSEKPNVWLRNCRMRPRV